MILDANGPDMVVADEVNEDGAVEFALHNSTGVLCYAALTVDQAVVLAQHLLTLAKHRQGMKVGDKVRVIETAWDDLRGQVGVVTHLMGSGNLQVLVGITSLVVHPNSVEAVK